MSCHRAHTIRTLHLLTGFAEGWLAQIVDMNANKSDLPPIRLTTAGQSVGSSHRDDTHGRTASSLLARTLLMTLRSAHTLRRTDVLRLLPRMIALARVIIADADALLVPSAPDDLIRHVEADVLNLPPPEPLPDPLPSTDDDLVRALLAGRRYGDPLPPTINERLQHLPPPHWARMVLAGIIPLPHHPEPRYARALLAAGCWDDSWMPLIEDDPVSVARALAINPSLITPQRLDIIATMPHAAALLLSAVPSLHGYDRLVRQAASRPTTARDVLIRHTEAWAVPELIRTVARDPAAARDVLIHRTEAWAVPELIRTVARDPAAARDVLIHRTEAWAVPGLIRTVAGDPAAARDVLIHRTEAWAVPELIRTVARNIDHFSDVIVACPDRWDDATLRAQSTYPVAAAQAMVRQPAMRTDERVHAIAHAPKAAAILLGAYPDLRTSERLIHAAARDPAAARDVLIHCPDLRTSERLIHAAAQWPVMARDVLIHCPDLHDHAVLWAGMARSPKVVAHVLHASPALIHHPYLLAMIRGTIDSQIPDSDHLTNPPLELLPPRDRIVSLLDAVGPLPALWRQLSADEQQAWITANQLPKRTVQWIHRLAKREAHESLSWSDRDETFARRHPATAPLIAWMRRLRSGA